MMDKWDYILLGFTAGVAVTLCLCGYVVQLKLQGIL